MVRGKDTAAKAVTKTVTKPVNKDDRQWHVIDANGKVLGRVASHAARLLQGKHKPTWVPSLDHGDFVVVVNAAKDSTHRPQGKSEALPVPQRV